MLLKYSQIRCQLEFSAFPQTTYFNSTADQNQRRRDRLHRRLASALHHQVRLQQVQLRSRPLRAEPEPGGQAWNLSGVSEPGTVLGELLDVNVLLHFA